MTTDNIINLLIIACSGLFVWSLAAMLTIWGERRGNGKDNEVTREQIEAQLAKCPLEWEEDIEGKLTAKVCDLDREVSIIYRLIEDDVYMKAANGCGRFVGEFLGVEGGEEALKTIAEAHRLDFICRLLGVKE